MQSGIAKDSGENTKQLLIFPGEARDRAVPNAPNNHLPLRWGAARRGKSW